MQQSQLGMQAARVAAACPASRTIRKVACGMTRLPACRRITVCGTARLPTSRRKLCCLLYVRFVKRKTLSCFAMLVCSKSPPAALTIKTETLRAIKDAGVINFAIKHDLSSRFCEFAVRVPNWVIMKKPKLEFIESLVLWKDVRGSSHDI